MAVTKSLNGMQERAARYVYGINPAMLTSNPHTR